MNIQSLILLGVTVSIFLMVLTVGMRVAPGDLMCVLRQPSRLVKGLISINVLMPIITVLVCKSFSLHPAVIIGLLTLSVAPVSALFSKDMLPLVSAERADYARGILFASTLLSVILTPLAVEAIDLALGGDVHVDPLAVAPVVVSSVLLPLGVGLAFARWSPATRRWIPLLEKLSALVLLACVIPILIGTWPLMASLFREGTLTAIIIVTFIGLAVGHFLGGPEEDNRTVLAFANVMRHPGVAIAVASLTDERLAKIGVLVAVLVSALAVVPYKLWRKRLHAAAAAPPRPSPPTPTR